MLGNCINDGFVGKVFIKSVGEIFDEEFSGDCV